MPEVDPTLLNAVLEELGQAVAADGGAAVYLADEDGVIQLAASVGQANAGSPSLIHRLLGRSSEADRRTLVMSLPGSPPGFVVLKAPHGQRLHPTGRDAGQALPAPPGRGRRGRRQPDAGEWLDPPA